MDTAALQPTSIRGYKIRLESPRFTKKLRLIYQLFVFLSGIAALGISYMFRFDLTITGISLICSLSMSYLLYQILKRIVTGSIHGDYLIVTHRLTKKSKVVDIRHLKSIRSRSFLGIPATQFVYNLDGEIRRVVILGCQEKNMNITQLLRNIRKAA